MCRLRPIQYDDMAAIVSVENAAHITPWSEATLRECLRAGYQCELIELANQCRGFSISRLGPDDTELLNVCVHPEAQGRGFGRMLLGAVVTRARSNKSERVLLDVRESNAVAQALYAKSGFEILGQRPGYYRTAEGGPENAVIMALDLRHR